MAQKYTSFHQRTGCSFAIRNMFLHHIFFWDAREKKKKKKDDARATHMSSSGQTYLAYTLKKESCCSQKAVQQIPGCSHKPSATVNTLSSTQVSLKYSCSLSEQNHSQHLGRRMSAPSLPLQFCDTNARRRLHWRCG